ncbi:MAG: hypothetical protein ACI35O_02465 [Bacillaceae bacterium]
MESEEYKKMVSDYSDYAATFASGFVSNLFSNGIITEIEAEKLKEYFSNPDKYQEEIENLAQYFYIASAEVHQLFELIEALPNLNYKIDSHEDHKNHEKFASTITKTMHRIKHKRLTRDCIKQSASSGTLVGIWLGNKSNLYPYIFDKVKYTFPSHRGVNGDWVCVIDMTYVHNMKERERDIFLKNLSPYITQEHYENFLKDITNNKYVELPTDRTFAVRTGTLKRSQQLGTSWITSGLFDVLHKKKLKDVEQSIANKIINAVAVLTIGNIGTKDFHDYSNMKLPKGVKQKVHSRVKEALEKNTSNGITVVSVPDFAELEFPDVKTDGLDGKKFEHINNDIQSAYGLSGAVLNGNGSNISSAKLNLETLYKRIAVLLEDIEQEVYQKMINLLLPSTQKDNFYISYDKEVPLTLKEKLDALTKLNDKGWSIKHVVDNIAGVSWDAYLKQTLYETEELKLQDKIHPYRTSHTMNGNEGAGRPGMEVQDVENENTMKSIDNDSNDK